MQRGQLYLALNANESIDVTPTAYTTNDTISVSIDGIVYSVTGTDTLSTTIDNFISAHKQAISDIHNGYLVDRSTYIEIVNVSKIRNVSATNATVSGVRPTEGYTNIVGEEFQIIQNGSSIELFTGSFKGGNLRQFTFQFDSVYKADDAVNQINSSLSYWNKYPYNLNLPYLASASSGTQLFLDLYPNAAAAYSLVKIRSEYDGDCIRVRESGGDTEADIGFNSDGTLDTVALLAHCGANDGFVKVWYDQSGNSKDASNNTTIRQPKIVNSGSLITQGGKPAIAFYDGLYSMRLAHGTGVYSSTAYFFMVVETGASGLESGVYTKGTTRGSQSTREVDLFKGDSFGVYNPIEGGKTITNSYGANEYRLLSAGFTSDRIDFSVDGSLVTDSNSIVPLDNFNGYLGGFRSSDELFTFDGKFQELIIYASDKGDERQDIEANRADYYGITLS